MEEVEISEMERGCLRRQLNDQETREIEKLATTVTEHIELNEGEEGVEHWKKHSIYKVPEPLASINREAFAPKVVSLGPYHHGEAHLQPMEVHKHRAARQFIQNSKKCTKDYVEVLWEVLPELMDSYSQLDHKWMGENNRGRFLELMLIDGCFLLEILRICSWDELRGYDEHDPVFSGSGLAFNLYVWLDLYMLENQVPFTALVRLLTVQNDKTSDENCKHINNLMSLFVVRRPDPGVIWGLHMLDIARKVLVEPIVMEPVDEEEVAPVETVMVVRELIGGLHRARKDTLVAMDKMTTAAKCRSVKELCHAGVEFRAANDDVASLSCIELKNGVLTMPIIRPSFEMEVLARNMVAFEEMHGTPDNAAFYISFMNGLLSSAVDVRHLRALRIIQSTDLSDDEILQTFKRLASGKLIVNPFHTLYRIQDQLDKIYLKRTTGCGGRLWKWMTSLKQKYFNNPWTFIAVVSATLLLALTMAQTYYAARPYWAIKHKNN